LQDGARALQSRTLNKQMIYEKIPSLFAFLASVPRMKRAVVLCLFMQALRSKNEMKNIPGAFRSKKHKSNHSAQVLRYKCFDRRWAGGGLKQR
jgi:hypothetical protein